jgi:hypothetical protein
MLSKQYSIKNINTTYAKNVFLYLFLVKLLIYVYFNLIALLYNFDAGFSSAALN